MVRPIFLDTAGLVAIWDRRDQWHEAARRAYALHVRNGAVTITTNLVMFEAANSVSRLLAVRRVLVQFRQTLIRERRLVEPSAHEIEQAWSQYQHGVPGSFVDLVSFEVMRRIDAHEVFSNDRHFRTAGFITLF